MASGMAMAIFEYKAKACMKAPSQKISRTALELSASPQEIPIVASSQEEDSTETENTSGLQETVTKEIFMRAADTARANCC